MLPRKVVEHLFRLLPVLIIVPIVALALAAVWASQSVPEYESRATLWVSEIGTAGGSELTLGAENTYASPSQRQSHSLSQLFQTESFALAVAQRSGLLDETSDRDTDWRTLEYVEREAAAVSLVRKRVWSTSAGTNLMVITARSSNPDRAHALVEATTALFLERISSEASRKTDLVMEFYEQRLVGAVATLDQADRALRDYVAANPRVNDVRVIDPTLQRLTAAFDAQNLLVTKMREGLQEAQLDAVTNAEGQKGRYAVIDAPTVPTVPVSTGLKEQALPWAAALAIGLVVAGGLAAVSFATDHTVRSSDEVTALGVPVLAFMPEFDSRETQPWVVRKLVRRDRAFARKLAADLPELQLERGA